MPPYQELPLLAPVETVESLDPTAYLAANPDVGIAGLDPRDHFERYGMAEGRRQFVNGVPIHLLRAAKLAALSFRPGVDLTSALLGPLDCLPPATRDGFELPEYPPVAVGEYTPEIVALIRANPDRMFLDVGAGLQHTYYSNVVNLEIWHAPSTDVIALAEDMPFADAQFDFVLCLAVLEHTRHPWLAVREMIRVTRPDGVIRVDWPFLQPVHGYPHHYFNATAKGATSLFEELCEIQSCDVHPWQHPMFALHWLLREWRAALPEDEQPGFDQLTISDVLGVPPQAHLANAYCASLPAAAQDVIAAGSTLIARKRP
jgi:SAM-dependent methyltransferase